MKQIFIKVSTDKGIYNKDIRDSNYEERLKYYNRLTRGQIIGLLEQTGNFNNNLKGGN